MADYDMGADLFTLTDEEGCKQLRLWRKRKWMRTE